MSDLKSRMEMGGLREALIRAALYVGMSHGSLDERTAEAIRRIRATTTPAERLSPIAFKEMVRDQYFMLIIDEKEALANLPKLLPTSREERRRAFSLLESIWSAGDHEEDGERVNEIRRLFDIGEDDLERARVRRLSR